MTIIGISISGCTCNECEAVRNGDELLRPQVNHVAGAAVAKVTCEGDYRTCPCFDCEAVRVSPRKLSRPQPSDDDAMWLPVGRIPSDIDEGKLQAAIAAMAKAPTAALVIEDSEREQLIADGFASLVDMVGIVRRSGGYLKPDDQALLRIAEAVIAKARTTP